MAQSEKWIEAAPDEPVAQVAQRSLKSRLSVVQKYLPLAAFHWEDDPEYVHALRVASRRSQAAIAMYGDLLPDRRARRLRKQLKRIRKATNDARDDDVFLARLQAVDHNAAEHKAAARLAKRVGEHRWRSQRFIVDVHHWLEDDQAWRQQIDQLISRTRLRGKRLKTMNPRFGVWSKAQFANLWSQFMLAANVELGDLQALHEFRITCKKIRYAMEMLGGAFSKEFRIENYARLAKLQDRLGEINDLVTSEKRIKFWIAQGAAKKTEVSYLQEILEQEIELRQQKFAKFADWWHRKRQAGMFDRLKGFVD